MQKVLVNFIQDRSGSMGTVWAETLSGFAAFVENLKAKGVKDGVEYLFSLTTFDTLIETPYVAKPIAEVSKDELSQYGPRGATALYDAVGKTIEATAADAKGADKIICVIVTDGQENSSREWSKDALNAVIAAKLALGNWTFTYLGTQPETWDDAQALGIAVGATAGYQGRMAQSAYAAVSHAVHTLAASSDRQSKNLFASRHASAARMRAAGMTIQPETTPVPADPASPTPDRPPSTPTRRWR